MKYDIIVCNDDGIHSPGLKAAVEAVVDLGNVLVVAPSKQQTAMGRSMTGDPNSGFQKIDYDVNGQAVDAYHLDGSPAMVLRSALCIFFNGQLPKLVVSGINYGENLGSNITISGTLGVAFEAANSGIPNIAVSKQTSVDSHHNDTDQDWGISIDTTRKFAKQVMEKGLPDQVDVLKIDIPDAAQSADDWLSSSLSKLPYYQNSFANPGLDCKLGDTIVSVDVDMERLEKQSDIHVFMVEGKIAVTPITTSHTAPVQLSDIQTFY